MKQEEEPVVDESDVEQDLEEEPNVDESDVKQEEEEPDVDKSDVKQEEEPDVVYESDVKQEEEPDVDEDVNQEEEETCQHGNQVGLCFTCDYSLQDDQAEVEQEDEANYHDESVKQEGEADVDDVGTPYSQAEESHLRQEESEEDVKCWV